MPVATAVQSSFDAANKQIGDGQSRTWNETQLALYNGTPVSQPGGNAASALIRGQAGGSIMTFHTAQSPASVAVNTTAEQSFTVQSGTVTNAPLLIASGDLLYINKPTAQAGLGMGNVRYSSSNVAGVTFGNWTAATITPTSSQNYSIVALRGMNTVSATLSPASVAANSTVEQQFTITPTAAAPQGLPVGQLVQVSKPTAQAGIDIVGCRVVSNNVIGITFCNLTASAVTPTAAESYTIIALGGLDAENNLVGYQFNAGTIGAIAAGFQPTGGATTVTGVLATDIAIGPAFSGAVVPSATGTNAAFPAFSLLAANAITMEFCGIGTGGTPTASLPYNQIVFRSNPVAPLVLYTQTLSPSSVAANTTAEQTFTVTGLISGTPVWVNKPSAQLGLGIAGVRVSATNTLAINYANSSAATITPASETYIIGNFQLPSPGAGNCVYQNAVPSNQKAKDMVAALRAALGPSGINALLAT